MNTIPNINGPRHTNPILFNNNKNNHIDLFDNNSTGKESSLKNIEQIKQKIVSIHHFKKSLTNEKISNKNYIECIKAIIGAKIYDDFCVAVSSTGKKSDGENLLLKNFRLCLSLRDSAHATPLDKLIEHFNNQIAIHQAIYEISSLEKTLLSYKKEKSKGATTAFALKEGAINAFKQLSPIAMGTLCRKLWELDNRPAGATYGYDTAIADILKLIEHKNCSLINESLLMLNKDTEATFSYEIKTVLPEQMEASDPSDLLEEIEKAHQLRDLKAYLNDNNKTNEFLFLKYEHMHAGIKKLLTHLIWLACDKPDEYGFSENLIKKNMRVLLKFQNSQGVDLVSQLICHTCEKIKLRRETSDLGKVRFEKFTEFYRICRNNNTPYSDLLKAYDQLDDISKETLRYQVWFQTGGERDKNFQSGNFNYGEETIRNNPFILNSMGSSNFIIFAAWEVNNKRHVELNKKAEKWNQFDQDLINDFDRCKSLPKDPIDVSSKIFEKQREQGLLPSLSEDQRVTFITAELAGVASTGGLAPAVKGMISAYGEKKVRVIMPLYRNGPINGTLIDGMKETKHEISVNEKKVKILKANIGDVRCYFVDIPELLSDGEIYWKDDKDFYLHQKRWVHFQKAAADLSYLISKKDKAANLVHVHDAQTSLVPKFLANHHPEEWARGQTPATVFTFHNNIVGPNTYENNDEKSLSFLEETGLPRQGTNPFIEGLVDADMVTTVSETFGKEAQDTSFGKGMHDFVKRAALKGKLVGIVNGNNTAEWDPKNGKLKDWVSCLPMTLGQKVDLSFGPDLSDKELAEKTKIMQEELCAYLKKQPKNNVGVESAYADLDPKKPIVMYLGRYDHHQKGIDKLPLIMEEVLKAGGQFICVGTGPTQEADEILTKMQKRANELGNKGVLILKDKWVKNQENKNVLKFQSVIGPLLRGACTLGVFPSSYEPCGLVQGEFNSYGKKAIATKTGGFGDTLNETNGYLFERHPNWNSEGQAESIKKTVHIAVNDAKAQQEALYLGDEGRIAPFMQEKRKMMNNALNSSWTKSPNSSIMAPIERMKLAYSRALENRKLRWKIHTDLNVFKV